MEAKLLKIATILNPDKASPLVSKLESEGIRCILKDENPINALPNNSIANGGINLIIGLQDFKNAILVLYQYENEYDIFIEQPVINYFNQLVSYQYDEIEHIPKEKQYLNHVIEDSEKFEISNRYVSFLFLVLIIFTFLYSVYYQYL